VVAGETVDRIQEPWAGLCRIATLGPVGVGVGVGKSGPHRVGVDPPVAEDLDPPFRDDPQTDAVI
jgi:hypothetical protein